MKSVVTIIIMVVFSLLVIGAATHENTCALALIVMAGGLSVAIARLRLGEAGAEAGEPTP